MNMNEEEEIDYKMVFMEGLSDLITVTNNGGKLSPMEILGCIELIVFDYKLQLSTRSLDLRQKKEENDRGVIF